MYNSTKGFVQVQFAKEAASTLSDDDSVIGLAAGGSWINGELDEFSDLDLILVTKNAVAPNKDKMKTYACKLGYLISAFTGEHVGEPRLLICLFDEPFLHVDIKFLTLPELEVRIEDPIILLDKDGSVADMINKTQPKKPVTDLQWIEDRFWIWIHYALLKVGRGEFFTAIDFLGFLRLSVLGPLLHLSNSSPPRDTRKLEFLLSNEEMEMMKSTLASHDKISLVSAIKHTITLYDHLRTELFDTSIEISGKAESRVRHYLDHISNKN